MREEVSISLSTETIMKPEGIKRDFPVLLPASLIMCFRNPFLGKSPSMTLNMQEGHGQSNLTIRMGEVPLHRTNDRCLGLVSETVILCDVKPSFSLLNTHTHTLTSLLFS